MAAADLTLSSEELQRLTDASAPEMDDYPYGVAGISQRNRPITGGR
jgi:hypothetical protein